MDASQLAFYLTGRRGEGMEPITNLRPALLAGYRDLTQLRYDFPVVLGAKIRSLTETFDDAFSEFAVGEKADKIRKIGFRLEREVRRELSAQPGASLGDLVAKCSAQQQTPAEEGAFTVLREALKSGAALVDCDRDLPARYFEHAWGLIQERKGRLTRSKIDRLLLGLKGILKTETVGSDEGRSAERLRAEIGPGQTDLFDFDRMASLLTTAVPSHPLPDARRSRIEALIDVLSNQRFFGPDGRPESQFVFTNCGDAIEAYRERLPALAVLVRALKVAELEVAGDYRAAKHDAVFEQFGASGLEAADLSGFPDYLVLLNSATMTGQQQNRLTKMLASDLPIKVVLQADDILESAPHAEGHLAVALRGNLLAHAALALSNVFVMQAPCSSLVQLRDAVFRGLEYEGPAVFSVFTGDNDHTSGIPPYLVSAAALESRAFPVYVYDPSAGSTWADRFSLQENPQPETDFPTRNVAFEDESLQMTVEDATFTLVDFVACDKRFARHFCNVPKAQWNGSFEKLPDTLRSSGTLSAGSLPERVPHVLMIDRENKLHRVVVDESIVRETRRCAEMWRSLQELGGIHNSHAERLLAIEREKWEKELAARAPATPAASTPAAPAPPPAATQPVAEVVAAIAEPVEEPKSDDPYIETPRCSTCNECTLINNRMFAYNENKQAYIKDPDAGTYRELVEAAESCQVSIIHPGKPRNPKEPGLDDLLKRAEPFL